MNNDPNQVSRAEVSQDESSIHFQSKVSRFEIQTKKPKSSIGSPHFILNDTEFSLGSPNYPITSLRTKLGESYYHEKSIPKCLLNTSKNSNQHAFSR